MKAVRKCVCSRSIDQPEFLQQRHTAPTLVLTALKIAMNVQLVGSSFSIYLDLGPDVTDRQAFIDDEILCLIHFIDEFDHM